MFICDIPFEANWVDLETIQNLSFMDGQWFLK